MADFIIGGQVNIDGGNAEKSVGSIKQQLREAQKELVAMADKFGATSKEAVKTAQKVGELKDKIGDAKLLSDAFNPDAKFKAFSNALQGVVGGFAALQGAQALFGNQSEDLQKTLAKVQGAMALSQGLNSVLEAKDAFKSLGAVIKTNVTSAFSSLKSAIISTGIGALVVGIGLLIANFEDVKKVVLNLIPGLATVGDFIGNLVNKITDFIGVTSEAERAQKKFIETTEKQIKSTERFLDTQGDKFDEFTKRKIQANLDYNKKAVEISKDETLNEKQKQQLLKDYRDKADREINKASDDRQAKIDEANKKEAEKNEKHKQELLDKEKKHNEDIANANKSLQEKLKTLREENYLSTIKDEDERAKAKLILDYENKIKEINSSIADETLKQQALAELDINFTNQKQAIVDERALKDKEAKDKATQTEIDTLNAELDSQLAFEDMLWQADDERTANEKKNAEDRIKQAELEAQAKTQYYKDIGNALGVLSDLIGKDTAAGKALAVAQATINTWLGATEVLKAKSILPEPVATISKIVNVAAIVASGIKSVKEILKTKVPGGSGGGGGGSISSAASATAIQAPIQAQLQTTTLNQSQIQQMGNAAVRSFVVESDVSGNQERIRRLNRAARIN
jgi:hypothetical protein